MPKTKQQKKQTLNQLQENLEKQRAMVFVNFKGLKVGDMMNLRNQLKDMDSKLIVSKKTLFSKAVQAKGIDADFAGMEGQVGIIFAFGDTMKPLKIAHAFGKTNENLKILGGFFENEIQGAARMLALANLPSREELLAKLLGAMAAPISGFATVLQGNIKGLVYILDQRSKMRVKN